MARTLVGILQIMLKQDVSAKAPEINRALASIQGAANRLGNSPWGAGFDRQLQRLKLSPAERAAVSASYGLLLATSAARSLGLTCQPGATECWVISRR